MKKPFQKTLIAASVGAVLAVAGISAVAGTPATANLLFPYIVSKASGAYTFISIAGQGGTVGQGVQRTLHFTYATKPFVAGATNAGDNCEHMDGNGNTSENDLMHFEVRNGASNTAILNAKDLPKQFQDETSVPKYLPDDGKDREGFLIVNNRSGSDYGAPKDGYAGASLYGEAVIVDTSTGLYWAYTTDDMHTSRYVMSPQNVPLFDDQSGPDGGFGMATADNAPANRTNSINEPVLTNKVLSWFPTGVAPTKLYVLPLGNEWDMAYTGGLKTQYTLTGRDPNYGGHYNNNETFQSHTVRKSVTCFGWITRDDLVGGMNNSFSSMGGWGNLVPDATGLASASFRNQALVFKSEKAGFQGSEKTFMTRLPTR